MRELKSEGIFAAYIDVAERSLAERVRGLVLQLNRYGTAGILVVDNCPGDIHAHLAEEMGGSRFSLLSIDYNMTQIPSGTSVYQKLDRLGDDDVRRIILSAYPHFTGPDVDRVVRFSHGWPLIALNVAKAVIEEGDEVSGATDELLVARLLGIDPADREKRRVISVISLFEHVGFEEPYSEHLPWIHENLCDGVDEDTFYEVLSEFERRGIIVKIGSLYRVTPPPVAVRLAGTWLEGAPPGKRAKLFDGDMPERLVEYLCRQFKYLDQVPRAKELASKLCGNDGPFGNAGALRSHSGARIFRSISHIAPRAALDTLVRVLSSWSQAERLAFGPGRRDIVFALEALLYPAEFFLDAARALSLLATSENERIANNATGVLATRFSPIASQTEAGADDRIKLIDELLSGDPRRSRSQRTASKEGLRPTC